MQPWAAWALWALWGPWARRLRRGGKALGLSATKAHCARSARADTHRAWPRRPCGAWLRRRRGRNPARRAQRSAQLRAHKRQTQKRKRTSSSSLAFFRGRSGESPRTQASWRGAARGAGEAARASGASARSREAAQLSRSAAARRAPTHLVRILLQQAGDARRGLLVCRVAEASARSDGGRGAALEAESRRVSHPRRSPWRRAAAPRGAPPVCARAACGTGC